MSLRTDDATRRRILDLAAQGYGHRETAGMVGVSHETVRRIRRATGLDVPAGSPAAEVPASPEPIAAAPEGPPPSPPSPTPPSSPPADVPADMAADVLGTLGTVPPIPPDLTGEAVDLYIVNERINAVRALLHQAQARIAAGASAHGLAALDAVLSKLVAQRQELRPPAPPDAAAEERAHRADADRVLASIASGVDAAESQARATLRAALSRWPGAADVAINALYGAAPPAPSRVSR